MNRQDAKAAKKNNHRIIGKTDALEAGSSGWTSEKTRRRSSIG